MRFLKNNPLLKFVVFRFLLGYVLGILFQNEFSFALNTKHLYVLLWMCVFLFLTAPEKMKMKIPIFFCFLMGILHTQKHQKQLQNITPFLSKKHQLQIEIIKKPKKGKKTFHGILHKIDTKNTNYKIYILFKNKQKDSLKIGDWIMTKSFLNPIKNWKNSNFDFKKYSHQNHFFAQSFVKNYKKIPAPSHHLKTYFLMFRESIKEKLKNTNLSENTQHFIAASLLGDRGVLPPKIIQNYTKAGVIHLLAVSGLHTGIIWGLFFVLLYPLRLIKRKGFLLQNLLALCFLWAFALLTGLQPPVLRAAILYSCIGISLVYGSSYDIRFAIWVAALFCLWFEPYLLFSVSFQMSYAAVFSITYLNPLLNRLLKPSNKLEQYFWGLLTVCLSAQIGVLPLSLYYFGKMPLLFLLSNILIVPLFTVILLGSSLTVFLVFLKILPDFLANSLNVFTNILNNLIEIYASYDFLILDNLKIKHLWGVFALYGIFIFLYFQMKKLQERVVF